MEPTVLNAAQKKHFATFGYLVLRQVFAPTEIDAIRREADAILCRNRAGKAFTGQRRQAMIPFFEYSPLLRTIMEDDRIYQLGVDLLGPDIILNASEGNLHVGDTAWHGGEAKIEPVAHIKIAFYLEKTTRNTGALRLIPGSNDPEYRRRLLPLKAQNDDPSQMPFGVAGADLPCHVVETEPGDLVVFPETTWHAAFGGPPGRSQHAINFMANPTTEAQVAYVRTLYESWNFSLHPVSELIESESPRLRSLVARLVELGFGPPNETPLFE